jgi:hypothetical protein
MTGATAKMTSTEITDWINTPAESATIDQDSLPYAGSSENPYTIEEAKEIWAKRCLGERIYCRLLFGNQLFIFRK